MKTFKRLIAGLTAALFLSSTILTPITEANIWQERKQAAQKNSQLYAQLTQPTNSNFQSIKTIPPTLDLGANISKRLAPSSGKSASNNLPEWAANVIAPFGAIQSTFVSSSKTSPFIIHVQDAHEVEDAQRNIAGLIEKLNDEKGQVLVGLEGAEGAFNTQAYRDYVSADVTKAMADFFLANGYITGAEYASFTMKQMPTLWGIENLSLYSKNIEAYKKSIRNKAEIEKQLAALKADLKTKKEKIFSNELKSFDRQYEAYHQGRSSLGIYVSYLLSQPSNTVHPNLALFNKTLSLEKSLNFGRIETERTHLIQSLVSKLNSAQTTELIQMSQKYQEREFSYADYYTYLKTLCSDQGVNLTKFPQFLAYVDYVIQAEKINSKALLTELAKQEASVREALATDKNQRDVLASSQLLVLVEGLTDHRMMESDWALYQTLRKNISSLSPALAELLTPFEEFYALATKRNESLVKNLLGKNSGQVALLVAGGFHTEGVTQILREKNISHIVVTPKINKFDPNHKALDVFARDQRPIEKIFAGHTVYLVAPLTTAVNAPATGEMRTTTMKRMMFIVAPVLEAVVRNLPNAQLRGFLMEKWSLASGRFPDFSVALESAEKKGASVTASARVGNTTYDVTMAQGSARNTNPHAVAIDLTVAGQPVSAAVSAQSHRPALISLPTMPRFAQAALDFVLAPFDYCVKVTMSARFTWPHRMLTAAVLISFVGLPLLAVRYLSPESQEALAFSFPIFGFRRKTNVISPDFLTSTTSQVTDSAKVISDGKKVKDSQGRDIPKLLDWRDLKDDEFLFEDAHIKLHPLVYHYLNIYGRDKAEYQVLRPIAEKLRTAKISIGKTNNPYFDIYTDTNEIRINEEFMEFFHISGRKKIFMSFMAGAVLELQRARGELTLSDDHFSALKHRVEVLAGAKRTSLFSEHPGLKRTDGKTPTRVDDVKYLYLLKKRVDANDPKQGESAKFAKRYFLSDEDVLLVISDILGGGQSISSRKLMRLLVEDYGHYGEITEKKAEILIEQFVRLNRAITKEEEGFFAEGDLEKLKSKLADGAKIKGDSLSSAVSKAVKPMKLVTLSAKYRTDPAFEPSEDGKQYTVTDVEADRIDEVHLGGKSAHTGEMVFAPHVISLPAFFSYGRTFTHLLKSNNSIDAYKAQLAAKRDRLKTLLDEAKQNPANYENMRGEDLHHFRKDMVVKFQMDLDENVDEHPLLDQLQDTLNVMNEILNELETNRELKELRDYYKLIGDALDKKIRALKETKKDLEHTKAEHQAKITALEKNKSQNEGKISELKKQVKEFEQKLEKANEEMEKISASEAKKLLVASRNLSVPQDVVKEVKDSMRNLAKRLGISVNDLIMAIRSSAVGEDSETASFAGRLTTWIFQTPYSFENDDEGLDYLISAWVAVQSSLFNKRANDYRLDHGLNTFEEGVEVSSPFQEMFLSLFSFIGFSVDSESGFPSIVMSFAHGQGENLVSGKVAGDRWTYSHDGKVVLHRMKAEGDQFKLVQSKENKRRLEQMPLSEKEKANFVMQDQKAVDAVAFGIRALHKFYKGYVDTEGALAPKGPGKGLAVVFTQVRPETVVSMQDENVLKLQKITVTEEAYLKAEKEGRVLDFHFIAKSAGTAQGEIMYVMDKSPQALAKAQGKVMLTMQSDPDMNSAMIAAKGIIAILGGPNSHTMIVAKEYGLVAITGTKAQLLSYLKNGDQVTIDAERGKVLLGYDHQLEISGNNFNVKDIPNTKPGEIRSATIVATRAKAFKQWVLSKIPSYKGIGLMRLEIVLSDVIKVYPEFLMAYDNYYKRKRGEIIPEGAPVLPDSVIANAENENLRQLYKNLLMKNAWRDAEEPKFDRDQTELNALVNNTLAAGLGWFRLIDDKEGRFKDHAAAPLVQLLGNAYTMPEAGRESKPDFVAKVARFLSDKLPITGEGVNDLAKWIIQYDFSEKIRYWKSLAGFQTLDPENDAQIIKDIQDIDALRMVISGYKSGEAFYKETLANWIRAHAETLNAPKEEVIIRAQKIGNDEVRRQVLAIVNNYYQMGLGHKEPLEELKSIRASRIDLSKKERALMDEIIGLLDKTLNIRLDDRKSDEYNNVIGAKRFLKEEHNAMMGLRGLDLLLLRPETTAWQLDAIAMVANEKRHKLSVFAPVVRRPQNALGMKKLLEMMDKHGLTKDVVKRGMMTEIPMNATEIRAFLRTGIDFISTGGNDGLQTIKRQDRNTGDQNLKATGSDFDLAFLRWNALIVNEVIAYNKEHGTHVEAGFCGNAPSVPGQEIFASVLKTFGYDSVSVVIEAYQGVATDITKSKWQWFWGFITRKVKRDALRMLRLAKKIKNFKFDIDENANPDDIDYHLIKTEDIRLSLPFHYRYIDKYDSGELDKSIAVVEKEIAELKAEQQNPAIEKKIKELSEKLSTLNQTKQAVEQWIADYVSPDATPAKRATAAYTAFLRRHLQDQLANVEDGKMIVLGTDDGETPGYRQKLGGDLEEPKEANPSLGLHGLVKVLSYDRSIFIAELETVNEFAQRNNHKMGVSLRTVRANFEIPQARKLINRHTDGALVGLDVTVAGNIFETDILLDRRNGLSFVTIDNPRDLTSQMMTLELENENGLELTEQDVKERLETPIGVIRTAAAKYGLAYRGPKNEKPKAKSSVSPEPAFQPGALFAPLIAAVFGKQSLAYASYVGLIGPVSETLALGLIASIDNSGLTMFIVSLGSAILHTGILMWANKIKERNWDELLIMSFIGYLFFFVALTLPFYHLDNLGLASLTSWGIHTLINIPLLIGGRSMERKEMLESDITVFLPHIKLQSTRIDGTIRPAEKARVGISSMARRIKLNLMFGNIPLSDLGLEQINSKIEELLARARSRNPYDDAHAVSQFGTYGDLTKELALWASLSDDLKLAENIETHGTKLALWTSLATKILGDEDSREDIVRVVGVMLQQVLTQLQSQSRFDDKWRRFRTDYLFGLAMAEKGRIQELKKDISIIDPNSDDLNRQQIPLFHLPSDSTTEDYAIAYQQAARTIRQHMRRNQQPYLTFISDQSTQDILKAIRESYGEDLPATLRIDAIANGLVRTKGGYSYDALFAAVSPKIAGFDAAVRSGLLVFPMWSPVLAQWQFTDPTSSTAQSLAKLILVQVISQSMSIVATLDDILNQMKADREAAKAA